MVKEKQLAVIGGDKRYIQLINYLAENDTTLFIEGFTDLDFPQKNVQHTTLKDLPFEKLNGIILPILGMDEKGQIQLDYPKNNVELTDEMIRRTPSHCVVYTGTAGERLKELARKNNRNLEVLFERDDIAIANSVPTAEATLQIAMENTDYTIHDSDVLIIGFGRIGITIARIFANIGANVTVAARKQADFARIKEMRLTPVSMDQLITIIPQINICVNTVPHPVVTKNIIQSMNIDSCIIDVASKPGGTDFTAAESRGINTIHALGLPGKVAPKTAGTIIAQTIIQLL